MNTDGASNKHGAGICIVLENSLGVLIEEVIRLNKKMTNNEVEYEALLYGLELALRLGVQHLKINLDSELVLGQLVGAFEAKDSCLKSYHDMAQSLMTEFRHVNVEAIRRELNSRADTLAKGATCGEYLKKIELVMMEDMIEGKGAKRLYKVNMVDATEGSSNGSNWMKEIADFLEESVLLKDRVKARKIRLKAAKYTIVREVLYKKSFSKPLLRCLTKD